MAEYKKGRVSRFLSLTGLTTTVGASYLGQKLKGAFVSRDTQTRSLQRANVRNAGRIARTLGELKGSVMKVGQMLSLQADLLPREMTEILSGLQRSAPPVPFQTIRRQIEVELALPLEQAFLEIEESALAAASIGQVHRARLHDGRAVVVKVQYPGVEQMVESDLRNLRALFKVVGQIGRASLDGVFAEVRERMLEEVDYEKELANLQSFRAALADDPRVIIPRPVPERSSRRVLTMELVQGMDADAICAAPIPQTVRDRIGETLVNLLLRQIFELRALHADPNLANFAFTDDGRVIVYDFGCVKRFEAGFVAAFARLLRDALGRRPERLSDDLARLGFADPGGKPAELEALAAYAEVLAEPWADRPYSFGTSQLYPRLLAVHARHGSRFHGYTIPAQMLFLNRVLGGMFGNLRRLGVRGSWGALLRRHLAAVPLGETEASAEESPLACAI